MVWRESVNILCNWDIPRDSSASRISQRSNECLRNGIAYAPEEQVCQGAGDTINEDAFFTLSGIRVTVSEHSSNFRTKK